MQITYNKKKTTNKLQKQIGKHAYLSGFPFGTIRRLRELKIQKKETKKKNKDQPKQLHPTRRSKCKKSKANPNF